MPVDPTRFKKLQAGYNKNTYNGTQVEDRRQQERQKAREQIDSEIERRRAEQREAARKERQGI